MDMAMNQILPADMRFFNLIYLSGCCHRQALDLCALKLEIVFIVIASINTKWAQHEPYH